MILNPISSSKALFEGLITVYKHLFRRPVTLEYPEKRRELNDAFRGKPEVSGCIGCGVCKRVCASGAIEFEKNEDGKVISYRFDLKKCIFCGNCAYYCPVKAIKMTKYYELGVENPEDLVLKYKGGADD